MKGIIDVLKSVWQKLMGNEFTRWLVYIGIVAFCFCIVYNAGNIGQLDCRIMTFVENINGACYLYGGKPRF